jgi:hypothetical protein
MHKSIVKTEEGDFYLRYADLRISKVFWWGTERLGPRTREFLAKRLLYNKEFIHAFHWPMIDQA